MRERREWVEVDHDILGRHADNTGKPLEWFASGEEIIGGIEKRCRDACGRSSGIVHIPQGALHGKKLRQSHQAKRLRIAQIVLLGCDRQLLHIFDGLKVVWSEFETAEHLLVVGVRPKAEGNLVPKPLILKGSNLLVTAIEKISGVNAGVSGMDLAPFWEEVASIHGLCSK